MFYRMKLAALTTSQVRICQTLNGNGIWKPSSTLLERHLRIIDADRGLFDARVDENNGTHQLSSICSERVAS